MPAAAWAAWAEAWRTSSPTCAERPRSEANAKRPRANARGLFASVVGSVLSDQATCGSVRSHKPDRPGQTRPVTRPNQPPRPGALGGARKRRRAVLGMVVLVRQRGARTGVDPTTTLRALLESTTTTSTLDDHHAPAPRRPPAAATTTAIATDATTAAPRRPRRRSTRRGRGGCRGTSPRCAPRPSRLA